LNVSLITTHWNCNLCESKIAVTQKHDCGRTSADSDHDVAVTVSIDVPAAEVKSRTHNRDIQILLESQGSAPIVH